MKQKLPSAQIYILIYCLRYSRQVCYAQKLNYMNNNDVEFQTHQRQECLWKSFHFGDH